MPRTLEGKLTGEGLRVSLVVSRFNQFFTRKLLEGAQDALVRHGVADEDITVVLVPGSFEIPWAARRMAVTGRYDAVVCLGVLVRGDTPHFDYVAAEVTKGIAAVSLETGVPVIFGVITADSLEQAIERSGSKGGNKGFQAAEAAIEMANLNRVLETAGR
ncbi:MAG: 6,7-dimethyl-8-ribityllumazine synthase [bacterium]|jgi:6,7-dimethyl-8-ribityllumazine synthase|nr:6,7-dimethyl-8-ribityllumazine synthase [bacterium]